MFKDGGHMIRVDVKLKFYFKKHVLFHEQTLILLSWSVKKKKKKVCHKQKIYIRQVDRKFQKSAEQQYIHRVKA